MATRYFVKMTATGPSYIFRIRRDLSVELYDPTRRAWLNGDATINGLAILEPPVEHQTRLDLE